MKIANEFAVFRFFEGPTVRAKMIGKTGRKFGDRVVKYKIELEQLEILVRVFRGIHVDFNIESSGLHISPDADACL